MYNWRGGHYYNAKEAVAWFHKAADQGLKEAQNDLGLCYSRGSVERDDREAMRWYRKAADQDFFCQFTISVLFT